MTNITNYWTQPSAQREQIRKVVVPSAPKCDECGKHPVQLRKCWYCECVICSDCTCNETWGDAPITVCKSCHAYDKEVDALIAREVAALKEMTP